MRGLPKGHPFPCESIREAVTTDRSREAVTGFASRDSENMTALAAADYEGVHCWHLLNLLPARTSCAATAINAARCGYQEIELITFMQPREPLNSPL